MAIIKLGEIAKINMCKRVLAKETSKYGEVPFYKIGTLGKKSDSFITKELFNYLKNNYKYPELGDTLISCSGTIGKIIEFKGEDSYFQDSNIVWLSTSKLLKKYIFYWLSKNPFMATQGATIKRLYNSNIEHTYIFVPSLKEQQKIIDIIEPLEELKNNLNKQLELFSKYSEFIMTEYNILEKMNKRCQFLKGESVANFSKGQTLFLNVAAANGNSNKYCDNTPNVFPKDVTLSLDGNTGLVNNNLLGFNGYLYKLKSEVIPNWQIYYSLKNKINQKVIKLNEIGTTIKHSSNSKKELLLLDFKQKNILEKIFYFEINLKNQINLIEKQIKKIISILIK
ncbi:MAG: restriction endonuclease subunit S [Spiroplasma sp.]